MLTKAIGFLIVVSAIVMTVSTVSSLYLIATMDKPVYSQVEDSRTVIGHRIGPDGNLQLIYHTN